MPGRGFTTVTDVVMGSFHLCKSGSAAWTGLKQSDMHGDLSLACNHRRFELNTEIQRTKVYVSDIHPSKLWPVHSKKFTVCFWKGVLCSSCLY